jgi:hypothetical protein
MSPSPDSLTYCTIEVERPTEMEGKGCFALTISSDTPEQKIKRSGRAYQQARSYNRSEFAVDGTVNDEWGSTREVICVPESKGVNILGEVC